MGYIIAVLFNCLGKLFADEFKAWLPWITERVVRGAVSILPTDQQVRYGEEWRSDLNEIPGELSRFFWALDLIRAAYKVSNNHVFRGLFDRLAALLILSLCGPMFLVIALLIKLTSPGPAMSIRVMKYGGHVFKFRSFRISSYDLARFGPYAVLHGHPRMTPMTHGEEVQLRRIFRDRSVTLIGRFLIHTEIYLLPHLLNVLYGHIPLI